MPAAPSRLLLPFLLVVAACDVGDEQLLAEGELPDEVADGELENWEDDPLEPGDYVVEDADALPEDPDLPLVCHSCATCVSHVRCRRRLPAHDLSLWSVKKRLAHTQTPHAGCAAIIPSVSRANRRYGHIAYVEKVWSNHQITISEAGWRGHGLCGHRRATPNRLNVYGFRCRRP